ncbi:hypothetical protein ACIQMR_20975 [Streptomyces sp. NPDC091376]|uniref:hypothetical protein n=1 Tax=Streptomyces sp. NPDC091376 TaxID=3365994 RepID=UPI0037F672FA
MKPDVAAVSAAQPAKGAVPGPIPRVLLAAVPVLSLGMLGAVPSYVIAARRGTRADWAAVAVFTAATVGWLLQAAFTPVDTHGWQFAADCVLLGLSTAGAALHCLLVGSPAGGSR